MPLGSVSRQFTDIRLEVQKNSALKDSNFCLRGEVWCEASKGKNPLPGGVEPMIARALNAELSAQLSSKFTRIGSTCVIPRAVVGLWASQL
jgi:hypothetical protein